MLKLYWIQHCEKSEERARRGQKHMDARYHELRSMTENQKMSLTAGNAKIRVGKFTIGQTTVRTCLWATGKAGNHNTASLVKLARAILHAIICSCYLESWSLAVLPCCCNSSRYMQRSLHLASFASESADMKSIFNRYCWDPMWCSLKLVRNPGLTTKLVWLQTAKIISNPSFGMRIFPRLDSIKTMLSAIDCKLMDLGRITVVHVPIRAP